MMVVVVMMARLDKNAPLSESTVKWSALLMRPYCRSHRINTSMAKLCKRASMHYDSKQNESLKVSWLLLSFLLLLLLSFVVVVYRFR